MSVAIALQQNKCRWHHLHTREKKRWKTLQILCYSDTFSELYVGVNIDVCYTMISSWCDGFTNQVLVDSFTNTYWVIGLQNNRWVGAAFDIFVADF